MEVTQTLICTLTHPGVLATSRTTHTRIQSPPPTPAAALPPPAVSPLATAASRLHPGARYSTPAVRRGPCRSCRLVAREAWPPPALLMEELTFEAYLLAPRRSPRSEGLATTHLRPPLPPLVRDGDAVPAHPGSGTPWACVPLSSATPAIHLRNAASSPAPTRCTPLPRHQCMVVLAAVGILPSSVHQGGSARDRG